jgi:hypothetical protein
MFTCKQNQQLQKHGGLILLRAPLCIAPSYGCHTNVEALQMDLQQSICYQYMSVTKKQNFNITMTAGKKKQLALDESLFINYRIACMLHWKTQNQEIHQKTSHIQPNLLILVQAANKSIVWERAALT